jgi:hypothetical protein
MLDYLQEQAAGLKLVRFLKWSISGQSHHGRGLKVEKTLDFTGAP